MCPRGNLSSKITVTFCCDTESVSRENYVDEAKLTSTVFIIILNVRTAPSGGSSGAMVVAVAVVRINRFSCNHQKLRSSFANFYLQA